MRDYRFNAILVEECCRLGRLLPDHLCSRTTSWVPYLLDLANEEQQARWLPECRSGELIGAIAMTEPGTGSDLRRSRPRAVRDGDHYVINGSKTFISNGTSADLVIVAAKTDPEAGAQGRLADHGRARHAGASSAAASSRRSACTARTPPSCSSTTCRVPAENLLGEEGQGFAS